MNQEATYSQWRI